MDCYKSHMLGWPIGSLLESFSIRVEPEKCTSSANIIKSGSVWFTSVAWQHRGQFIGVTNMGNFSINTPIHNKNRQRCPPFPVCILLVYIFTHTRLYLRIQFQQFLNNIFECWESCPLIFEWIWSFFLSLDVLSTAFCSTNKLK